jgi:hypothetical protein
MNLPHIAGIISNVDENIQRNLVSLESELDRRELLFRSVSNDSMKIQDIYKYQKAYKEGKIKEPLSHLIIIVDEFAELKSQYPDFMQALNRAARVGRALGIHLVLATQKPSGVVDNEIWSNSKFKWCLKVADASDSNEVIKRPEAAFINTPGRAYIQIGYDELFEMIQSYWSGAPYSNSDNNVKVVPISFVNLNGKREKVDLNKINKTLTMQNYEEEVLVLSRYITETAIAISCENNAMNQFNLRNVVCRKVPVLITYKESGKKLSSGHEIYRVKRYIHGLQVVDVDSKREMTTICELNPLEQMPDPITSDIPALPAMGSWVNLKNLGAKGDGSSDDTNILKMAIERYDTIYFPQGWYVITDTITLRENTALIGLNPISTQLVLPDNSESFGGFGGPKPFIETPRGGTCIITGIGIDAGGRNPRAIACRWMSGEKSFLSDAACRSRAPTFHRWRPSPADCPP